MMMPSLPTSILRRAERMEMPVVYADAVKALEACATMDEAKYYSDKSEALAAWAKIYGSQEDRKAAARLKLHAYARMGQLAEELRPIAVRPDRGCAQGPMSLLREHGLNEPQANNARMLGKLPRDKFDELCALGVTPAGARRRLINEDCSESYRAITRYAPTPFTSLAFIRKYPAKPLAQGLNLGEVATMRSKVRELIDWLDEFEQNLPYGYPESTKSN